ncbi:MAG: carbohydrate kinase family protein [Nitrospinota bacterium]
MSPNARFDVVGIGLNSVDFLCALPRFPEPDTKTRMDAFVRQGGGQTATAMVACARLGLKAAYRGAVGDDPVGELSLESLRAEGVDVDGVVVKAGRRSQCAVVLVDSRSGERTIVWDREARLEEDDVTRDRVTAGRCLLVDGHSLPAEIRAARWAREAGIPVVFDAERVGDGTRDLLALCDFVVGSQGFPALLTGRDDPRQALRDLHEAGPAVVGMTLGEGGALAFDGETFFESEGFEVPVADTTGAGDVFHAGCCYGVLHGWSVPKTLDFSNALAAMSCRSVGGRTGIPRLAEVLAFLRERGRLRED